jgi:SAM-dependent methyltransferase
VTTENDAAQIERNYFAWLGKRHRPAHGRRTAERQAAFFLPLLTPGMALLDIGCGPGSITAGLARAVAPGHTIGLDPDADALATARTSHAASNLAFRGGRAEELPFADASFDAVFAHAVLQHLDDPAQALREASRVLRPGGVIGIADADFGGSIIGPASEPLEQAITLMASLRRGRGDPFVGSKLGWLLSTAGFVDVQAGARADVDSGLPTTAFTGAAQAAYFGAPELKAYAATNGLATEAELDAICEAWEAWGRTPGAIWARFWCYATARRPR